MARVTPETVEHVARLARLSLEPGERDVFARQLDEVLRHAESLQALEASGADGTAAGGTRPVLREDEPAPSLPREASLGQAPDAQDGLFRVPRILG
jgi:aspartyl-tRNA(Asn)/glutamyl-tRNA(Gln) amidotransferase subunit C